MFCGVIAGSSAAAVVCRNGIGKIGDYQKGDFNAVEGSSLDMCLLPSSPAAVVESRTEMIAGVVNSQRPQRTQGPKRTNPKCGGDGTITRISLQGCRRLS